MPPCNLVDFNGVKTVKDIANLIQRVMPDYCGSPKDIYKKLFLIGRFKYGAAKEIERDLEYINDEKTIAMYQGHMVRVTKGYVTTWLWNLEGERKFIELFDQMKDELGDENEDPLEAIANTAISQLAEAEAADLLYKRRTPGHVEQVFHINIPELAKA